MLLLMLAVMVLGVSSKLDFNSTAYYIAWAPQVARDDFPQAHVASRDLYVIQPANFTSTLVTKLKSVGNRNAKVLLYFDFLNLPLFVQGSCSTGHVMGDKKVPPRVCETPEQPYYFCGPSAWQNYIQASFAASQMARLICPHKTPEVICQYPGMAAHFWTEHTADKATNLLAYFVRLLGADGVYLDGYCNAFIRQEIISRLYNASLTPNPGCGIDVNGDGKPETMPEALAQATGWGQYFVANLRSALGPEKIVLANAAGVNSDAFLNGITVEMEYCTDNSFCESAFLSSQRATKIAGLLKQPPLSVAWLKSPSTFPPKEQCAFAKSLQQKYPWVSVGVDIFDGEPVFCGF